MDEERNETVRTIETEPCPEHENDDSGTTPYDYDRPETIPHTPVFVAETDPRPARNVRRAISDTLKYFNAIKNFPLWYVLKSSTKFVTTEERLVADRESDDLKILKKIEKLKKKEKLFLEKKVEIAKILKNKKIELERKRRPIFKKIIVVAREAREEHSKLIGEFYRTVQRQCNRKKKETQIKKENAVHQTHMQIASRIPDEIKSNPIDFLVHKLFERERTDSGDQSERFSSLAASQEEIKKREE